MRTVTVLAVYLSKVDGASESKKVVCNYANSLEGMCFKWPCFLHSLVSPHWLPSDVVAEIWTNDSESLSVHKECDLTYSEFLDLSMKLSEHLRSLCPALVGILWSPTVYTLVAIHGVLLSPSAFLPLTSNERLTELLDLFGAVVCLSVEWDAPDGNFTCVQSAPFKVYIRNNRPLERLPASDLAYCITTSGSTGAPKLVLAGHSCVSANVVDLCARLPPATATSGVLITAPLTFDACIVQLYLGLATRRRSIFISGSVFFGLDGDLLAQVIASANVDTWQCTPSVFSRLPPQLVSVRRVWVFLGGEPCTPARIPKWAKHWRFFFLYGLTEVSAWNAIADADAIISEEPPRSGATPLGVPMAYSQVVLRDVDKKTSIGQLYIARIGGGYSTVEEPFTSIKLLASLHLMPKAGLVATGDFAIASSIGRSSLWFIGRKDRMIKIYGRKCHLECLESEIIMLLSNHLNDTHHRVINCRCEALPLRAHVQLNDALSPSENNDLKKWLLQRITFPISPCNVIISNSPLSLSSNGKVLGKSVQFMCLSSIGLVHPNRTQNPHQLTFQQLGGSSLRAMHLVENLTSDWPALKVKKALLLSTLFSRPFAEFIQVAQKVAAITGPEDAKKTLSPSTKKRWKRHIEYEAELVWSVTLGRCVDASPIIDSAKQNVFIGSHAGVFIKLCLITGEVVWSSTIGSRIEANACLFDDLVVFGTLGGQLYALRTADGVIMWTVEIGGAVKSAPTQVPNSSRLLVGSHARRVLAIESNGRTVWMTSLDKSPIVAPIAVDEKSEFAFVGTLGGGLHRIDVKLGTTSWSVSDLGPIFGAPTLLSDLGQVVVTTADGSVHCLSENGGERLWTATVTPRGGFFSPPVPSLYHSSLVLLANQSGHLHGLSLIDGSVVWSLDCCAVVQTAGARTAFPTTPSVILQRKRHHPLIVFARTDGYMFACDGHVDTPPTVHVIYRLPSETFSSPFTVHLKPDVLSILVGCRDDTVNRLDLDLKHSFSW